MSSIPIQSENGKYKIQIEIFKSGTSVYFYKKHRNILETQNQPLMEIDSLENSKEFYLLLKDKIDIIIEHIDSHINQKIRDGY